MNHTASTAPGIGAGLSPRVLVLLALAGVYVIWGSTYLAIRIGIADYPPFLMAAIRFPIAGGLMYAFLRWRGVAPPTRRQWFNCLVTSIFLLGMGNGLVCYAEQTVPSGIAAVAVASVGLFMAIFAGLYGQWPNRLEWLGLIVGFAGVVILNLGNGLRSSPLGAAALVLASIGWAYGSIWSRRRDMPAPAMGAAAQMLCGVVPLGLMALAAGERFTHVPSLRATAALVYLIVAGSIIGFTAYIWLLHNVRPALATSYAYVNPPVAVLVGVLFGGEAVHALDVAGTAVILAGVVAITLAKTKPR
ncbi:MAG: drug/metabolite exporter YedA [Proteobacteria bacterium]|nr:drug/metabolite exporter YedA [Pseudomonadota bacterium]